MKRICATCAKFKPSNGHEGECRALPPTIIAFNTDTSDYHGYWPLVGRHEWCWSYAANGTAVSVEIGRPTIE